MAQPLIRSVTVVVDMWQDEASPLSFQQAREVAVLELTRDVSGIKPHVNSCVQDGRFAIVSFRFSDYPYAHYH